MTSLCPLSCGVCTFNCTDTAESCVAWAQAPPSPLTFHLHPHHQAPSPLTLTLSPTAALTLTLTLALTLHPAPKQDGQCEENPLMMYKECPIACGVCTPECKDSKKQCSGWAESGGCNDNPVS